MCWGCEINNEDDPQHHDDAAGGCLLDKGLPCRELAAPALAPMLYCCLC